MSGEDGHVGVGVAAQARDLSCGGGGYECRERPLRSGEQVQPLRFKGSKSLETKQNSQFVVLCEV